MPRYGPPDASKAPRYTGIRTFARCPFVQDELDGVDVAVLGILFDTATTMRPGARFGPAAIRDASVLLRPWHPIQQVDVFGSLSIVDAGDLAVTPGNAERTASQIAEQLEPIVRRGVVPLVLGGDCSILLGSLLALAAYPVVVEPLLTLQEQSRLWTVGYVAFAMLTAGCGDVPRTNCEPYPDRTPCPRARRQRRLRGKMKVAACSDRRR
jgi:hypothetical protein